MCVCCLYISCNVLVAWSYNNGSQKHCVFPGLASVISKTLQIPRYLQNNGYIQEFYVHLPDIGIELGNFLKISFCKSIMHGFVWAGSYLRCCFSELVNSTRHDLSIQVGSHGFPKGVIILPIIEGSINILKHLDNPNTEVVFLYLLTFQLAVDMACGDWFAALQNPNYFDLFWGISAWQANRKNYMLKYVNVNIYIYTPFFTTWWYMIYYM